MPWEPVDLELLKQVLSETVVHGVPYTQSRVIKRLTGTDSWLLTAWMACQRAIRKQRPDAILTSGPPHHVHLLGMALKRRHGIPWIADFRDPWVWAARLHDPFTSRAYASWLENALEKSVVRQADAIIANAPRSRETFVAAYPEYAGKTFVITNGYDPDAFINIVKPVTSDQAIRISYCGQIYQGRDPRPFFDALRALLAERATGQQPIHVDFFGAYRLVDQTNFSEEEIRRRGLQEIISVHSEITYLQSLAEMVRSDILLIFDTPGRRIGVSAKLYEYIGSGRPILALVESDSDNAWVLRQAGSLYRIANPNDFESILSGLRELVNAVENGCPAIGHELRRSQFSRENLTRQLADVLNGLSKDVDNPSRV